MLVPQPDFELPDTHDLLEHFPPESQATLSAILALKRVKGCDELDALELINDVLTNVSTDCLSYLPPVQSVSFDDQHYLMMEQGYLQSPWYAAVQDFIGVLEKLLSDMNAASNVLRLRQGLEVVSDAFDLDYEQARDLGSRTAASIMEGFRELQQLGIRGALVRRTFELSNEVYPFHLKFLESQMTQAMFLEYTQMLWIILSVFQYMTASSLQ